MSKDKEGLKEVALLTKLKECLENNKAVRSLGLDDEELLKKENLTIEPVMEEFNNLNEKTKELKNKIEKEIEKINNLYENVNNGVTKNFKDKHEILIKEENNLKEKLKIEVTKVKEKLEIFL